MRTRKLILIAATILLFVGCNKNSYIIQGVTPVESSAIAILATTEGDTIASTPVSNGAFTFQGDIDSVCLAVIYINDSISGETMFLSNCVLEPGTISISIAEKDQLSGTPRNDQFNAYRNSEEMLTLNDQFMQLYQAYMEAYKTLPADQQQYVLPDLEHRIDSIETLINDYTRTHVLDLYNQNLDNKFGAAMLNIAISSLLTPEQADSILATATPVVQHFKPIAAYMERAQHLRETSAGQPFIDLEGIDFANGGTIRLSQIIQGKIAVVDFWASWCSPCKQEIKQNLINLYNKYRNQGVVVVGVDVWDKIDQHAEAVRSLGIQYPQLIDTTMNASTTYGFNAIPQIILISDDGTILARDLRGQAIEEAILEQLGR